MGVHYWTDSGAQNIIPFTVPGPGWASYDLDMTGAGLLGAGARGPARSSASRSWPVVDSPARLDSRSSSTGPGSTGPTRRRRPPARRPSVSSALARKAAPTTPPCRAIRGTSAGTDDIVSTGDLTIRSFDNGNLNGTTWANDSFVELPLRTPLNTDRYHRATIDVCFGGGFSFANAPGGGMNARFAWYDDGGGAWSETQDIIVYPGCNRMTIDLATTPAIAVNDENTVYKAGWRGLHISALRFDLNEDPGIRDFSLNEIRLADDAAFSTTYPITFVADSAGTADIYVTTNPAAWDGTKIGTSAVEPRQQHVHVGRRRIAERHVLGLRRSSHNGNAVGSAYSTGPVRIERPVPPTPSYFVPLNPARLLDTRDGTGGNVSPLATGR